MKKHLTVYPPKTDNSFMYQHMNTYLCKTENSEGGTRLDEHTHYAHYTLLCV